MVANEAKIHQCPNGMVYKHLLVIVRLSTMSKNPCIMSTIQGSDMTTWDVIQTRNWSFMHLVSSFGIKIFTPVNI